MKTLLLGAGSVPADDQDFPRNLLEIGGSPVLSHVIENLGSLAAGGRLVAMLTKDEAQAFHTARVVQLIEPTAEVVVVGATSGAACTALMAVDSVDPDEPLLVANADQIIDVDLPRVVASFEAAQLDAGVIVFDAVHPRWSYVRLEGDHVIEASEKRPISRNATAGFYWFARASDFFDAAMRMITKGAAVDGQFYVCPVLNELVLDGARIGVHRLDRNRYWTLRDSASVTRYETQLKFRASTPSLAAVQALIA